MKPGANIELRTKNSGLAAGIILVICCLAFGGGPVGVLHATEAASPLPVPAPTQRIFSEADALALLTTTLQKDYIKDRGELELSFKQTWPAPQLPNEPLTVKILEMPMAGVTPYFIIRFQLCTSSATVGTWQIAIQAHVWRDVWMARSNLKRGDLVEGADVARERFDTLKVREALADFSGGTANLELAEPVSTGAPLLARAVKARTVIHRGQAANALLQDGGLSVTTKVEALEDGAPGQLIHVRNSISRRDLSGRVLDSQTILISL